MNKLYRSLTTQRDFLKVSIAGMINTIGDGFDGLALSMLVFELSGSPFYFALNFAINAIPNLVIQPFMGALIERLSKKWVMIIADLGRCLLVSLLIFLNIYTDLNPMVVMLFSFLMTCFEAFRIPAATAMTPFILDKELYDVGTSFKQTSNSLAKIAATSLAGIVIAAFGINIALTVDVISFIISALILTTLKQHAIGSKNKEITCFQDLKAGLSFFLNHDFLLKLALFGASFQLLLTGMNVMIVPYILDSLGQNAAFVSYFNTIILVSTLLGTLLYPRLHQVKTNHWIFGSAMALTGLGVSGIAIIRFDFIIWVTAAIVGFVLGISIGFFQPALNVIFLSNVEKNMLSRAGSLFNALIYASAPLGSILASISLILLDYDLMFLVYGIILIVAAYLFLRNKKLQQIV